MGKIKVIDNLPAFVKSNADVMDGAMSRMAKDIVLVAKSRVPFKDGDLMKEIKPNRKGLLQHQVRVDSEYAAYQERGRRHDGSHVVRRYTTPSTGKNYLRNAARDIVKDALNYLKQAAKEARA